MDIRAVVLAVVAGIAAFILVGVAVSESTSAAIEFSVFLGIPAGAVAGIAAAASVYRLSGARDPATRRMALAGGGFGVVFLLVALPGVVLGIRGSITLPVATAAALAGAAAAYLRSRERYGTP